MKKISLILTCFAVGALLSFSAAQPTAPATMPAPPAHVDASAPIPKKDNGAFVKRHESFLARAKAGPIGLLFLGDSITDGWSHAPHIWQAYYDKFHPANFGIGGDTTQNVIWRIEQGELGGIHPRVVVLMLGTNNTRTHSAEEIFAADKKIVELIRAKIPETKVLLLAIFPRGDRKNRDGSIDSSEQKMAIIHAVNVGLAKLDDGKNIRYLDIGAHFLGQDGKIPFAIMPDQLHPNAAGYQLWADAMQPLLDEMMK
ncbi:MAG: GDSL family lipase [Opitutaceae bacterium]|nr:GDSL family lipase [Opitutaceae bacterium]